MGGDHIITSAGSFEKAGLFSQKLYSVFIVISMKGVQRRRRSLEFVTSMFSFGSCKANNPKETSFSSTANFDGSMTDFGTDFDTEGSMDPWLLQESKPDQAQRRSSKQSSRTGRSGKGSSRASSSTAAPERFSPRRSSKNKTGRSTANTGGFGHNSFTATKTESFAKIEPRRVRSGGKLIKTKKNEVLQTRSANQDNEDLFANFEPFGEPDSKPAIASEGTAYANRNTRSARNAAAAKEKPSRTQPIARQVPAENPQFEFEFALERPRNEPRNRSAKNRTSYALEDDKIQKPPTRRSHKLVRTNSSSSLNSFQSYNSAASEYSQQMMEEAMESYEKIMAEFDDDSLF